MKGNTFFAGVFGVILGILIVSVVRYTDYKKIRLSEELELCRMDAADADSFANMYRN